MSIRLKSINLRGLTRYFQRGSVVVTPPVDGGTVSNPGTVSGPFAGQQADGGYQVRNSEQTYTGNTLLTTVYPEGTKIVSGEFDENFPGYQDKTFTISPTHTFVDLIGAFTGYFILEPKDANGDPVDVSVNPDTPFHLVGRSDDGGNYDLVYLDSNNQQYHADKFFVQDAQDRPSEFQFTYLFGGAAPGGGGDPGGPPQGSFQDHVGRRYLRRSDELLDVLTNNLRYVELLVYEQGNPTPFAFEYGVYGDSGEHQTVGGMLDYFSSVREASIPWTLQRTPGTTSVQELNNTEGYLHIVDQGLNQLVVNELSSDLLGFGARDLWGDNGGPPGSPGGVDSTDGNPLPFNTFTNFGSGVQRSRSDALVSMDPDWYFVELSSYLGTTRPADHVSRFAIRNPDGSSRTLGELIDFLNQDNTVLLVNLAADPEVYEFTPSGRSTGYFQITASQGVFALEQLDINNNPYGAPALFG